MFVQATISCECGCVSRLELQSGKVSFVCPRCKKAMADSTYQELANIMGHFGDLNTDVLKHSTGLGEPKMRAITLSIADSED